MEELIAKRYVQALLSVTEKKKRAGVAEVLSGIAASFSDPKVSVIIEAPIVSTETKVNALLDAIGTKVDDKLVNFIKILGENKRLALIPAVTKMLNAELQKESNEYEGTVKSKAKLDDKELGELEATLKRYTGSTIKLSQEKSDLDGLRVAVDDLGIEVNFSKERVKEQLIDFIMKSQ